MRSNRAVVVLMGISNLIAVGALIASLFLFATRQAQIEKAIQTSSYNACTLLDGIIFSFHTPQGKAAAHKIIVLNPELGNCKRYSLHLQRVIPQ